MKVILFMAISLNGIIATKDNGEDFLSEDNWKTFVELANKAGCMIWGRKTQEIVSNWEQDYLDAIKDITKVIVSSNTSLELGGNYILANSPQDALHQLESKSFSEVILTGGSTLNSSFAKENLIDEVILNIEPAFIGEGIPIFNPTNFDMKLKFEMSKNISNQIIQLQYSVLK